MLLNKFIVKEIKTALVKIKNYFFLSTKVKKDFEESNVNINEVDKMKPVNITKKDLEKSFKLYEEKLVILSQNLSSQEPINRDNYNPKTEYYQLIGEDGSIQYIPITEL